MKSNINSGVDHCNAERGHEVDEDEDEDEELLETSKDLEMSRPFSMRKMKHNSALEGAVRRAFSMRALSPSGGGSGYHRIDLGNQFHYSWDVNADHEQPVNFIGARLDQSAILLQMKPRKLLKKKGSNILEACKRLFGL